MPSQASWTTLLLNPFCLMNKRTNIIFVFKANEKEKKHSFVARAVRM
jgi:hypothetical protein